MADTADGGRGSLFIHAVDFITHRLPRVFVLENVENLIKQHLPTFNAWLAALREVHSGSYMVDWRVLVTEEHGIPQWRRRVYIVGIRRDVYTQPFVWPEPVGDVPMDLLLDPAAPGRTLSRCRPRRTRLPPTSFPVSA